MAESMLSDAALARIDRDLDDLIIPDLDDLRAIVAETRSSRATITRLSAALIAIGAEVQRAQHES